MVIYLLGAPDPEMAAIEALLGLTKQRCLYAGVRTPTTGPVRVTPRDAYRADCLIDPETGEEARPARFAVLVECDGPIVAGLDVVARCDHHHQGDAGYGRPPAEFLPASSLGQVIAGLAHRDAIPRGWHSNGKVVRPWGDFVGRVSIDAQGDWWVGVRYPDGHWPMLVPHALVLAAAADHCLAAAYAGQCPGVGPAELATHRARQRAEWLARGPGQGRDEARAAAALVVGAALASLDTHGVEGWAGAVRAAYEHTRAQLEIAPRVQLRPGDGAEAVEVIDLRRGTLPELPEVLSQTGQAALYRMVPPPGARDRRPKVGVLGGGEGSVPGTAPIEAFLGWADQFLVDLYGDPVRGYAGGYEEELES